MTIKEQINKKIEEYKKDFFEECGFDLIIIPKVTIPLVPIYDIARYCCDFLDISIDDLDTRKKDAVKAKEFVFGISTKMGYRDEEIYKALSLDRTTIYDLSNRFIDALKENRPYKYQFYQFYEYLYIQLNNKEHIKGKDWLDKVDFLDTIFISEDKKTGVTTKQKPESLAISYINENTTTKSKHIVDYLVKERVIGSKGAAYVVISRLKNKNKIYRDSEKNWKLI